MSNRETKFPKGSEWRRWDLHVHTKGTNKNDKFVSKDFNSFCLNLFKKACEQNIAVIGITDYFSIENYEKVKSFQDSMSEGTVAEGLTTDEVSQSKSILLLPNVELRMLPSTNSGGLVNIHCIFNPEIVDNLGHDFFEKVQANAGGKGSFSMTRPGITRLGKHMDSSLSNDDDAAYKEGIEKFYVTPSELKDVLSNNEDLSENCFIAVSNSRQDGASAFNKHYDLFENEVGSSLDAVRRSIYTMSDFVFSGNPKDRQYFLGKKSDSIEKVCNEVGSLKPCIHGSDAHTEDKLFKPDLDRFCWIKADPSFEGLRQIKYEPQERVFIGKIPESIKRVKNDSTRYIRSLSVNKKDSKTPKLGNWFGDTDLPLSSELVSIIGNKGGGKSAIADVIGFLGNSKKGIVKQNYSFLNDERFKQKGLADCFDATLFWHDDTESKACLIDKPDPTSPERVQYIPQNFFETLTNELSLEKFESELKRVVFSHLPESFRAGRESFDELAADKTRSIESDIYTIKSEIESLAKELARFEKLRLPSELESTKKELEAKRIELTAHLKNKPEKPKLDADEPESGIENKRIEEINEELNALDESIRGSEYLLSSLQNEKTDFLRAYSELSSIESQVSNFKNSFSELLAKRGVETDSITFSYNKSDFEQKTLEIEKEIASLESKLISKDEIDEKLAFEINPSAIEEQLSKESLRVKYDTLVTERGMLKEKISQPARDRQNYLENLKIWETQKELIEGDSENPNSNTSSIAYFEYKKRFISNNLDEHVKGLRDTLLEKTKLIFTKKTEILSLYNSFKETLENKVKGLSGDDNSGLIIGVETAFKLGTNIEDRLLDLIDTRKKGSFLTGDTKSLLKDIFKDQNFQNQESLEKALKELLECIDIDKRDDKGTPRFLVEQISRDPEEFIRLIFNLDYIKPVYKLKLDEKDLQELSPGEKGALLLVFYLTLDKESVPLIIDQPEDNLDNQTVYKLLTHYIKEAKKHRQIIIVTHNPNLAIGADAEQVIYVGLDKTNDHKFVYVTGAIEEPLVNAKVVEVLEGTMPAFDKRRLKYLN